VITSPTKAQHQVLMEEPAALTRKETRLIFIHALSIVGFFAPVALMPFSVLAVVLVVADARVTTIGLAFFLLILIFVIGTRWMFSRTKAKSWNEKLTTKQAEAHQLTQQASNALASSVRIASDLPAALAAANGWLRKAETEFQERAFGPFWDAIERAAGNLEVFRKGVTTVNQNADTFYKTLEKRQHSFPRFGTRPETLPDPKPVLEDLQQLVRRGQTDFQCANLWEQRRTREGLIAGFRTLEDGISHLGHAISNSLSDFQSTLSSQLAESVEQEAALRETVEPQVEERT
jgi:hypothetical protein